jgi:hypothetical protein
MKTFAQRFPDYKTYHEAVVAGLVARFGKHTMTFFDKRHTFEWAFDEQKEPQDVIDKLHTEYMR